MSGCGLSRAAVGGMDGCWLANGGMCERAVVGRAIDYKPAFSLGHPPMLLCALDFRSI